MSYAVTIGFLSHTATLLVYQAISRSFTSHSGVGRTAATNAVAVAGCLPDLQPLSRRLLLQDYFKAPGPTPSIYSSCTRPLV